MSSSETAGRNLIEQRNRLLKAGFTLAFTAYPDEESGELDDEAVSEAVAELEGEVGLENVAELDGAFALDGTPKVSVGAVSVYVRRSAEP